MRQAGRLRLDGEVGSGSRRKNFFWSFPDGMVDEDGNVRGAPFSGWIREGRRVTTGVVDPRKRGNNRRVQAERFSFQPNR